MRTESFSEILTEFIREIDMGFFDFSDKILDAARQAEIKAARSFGDIDETGEYNKKLPRTGAFENERKTWKRKLLRQGPEQNHRQGDQLRSSWELSVWTG